MNKSATGSMSVPSEEREHDLSVNSIAQQQRSPAHRNRPQLNQSTDIKRRSSNGANGNARWTQGLRRGSSTAPRAKHSLKPIDSQTNERHLPVRSTKKDSRVHFSNEEATAQESTTTRPPPKFKLCLEDVARYRQASQQIEAKIRARKAVHIWRSVTVAARFQGPFEVPQHNTATVGSFTKLQETAEGAVTGFLLACLRRCEDRKSGNDLVMLTLHPRLLQIDRNGGGSTIRKHIFKQLHGFKKHAVASYVCGTALENNLTINRRAIVFEFDRSAQKGGRSICSDGATSKVYVVTSIALPPSRGVQVTRYGGRWLVSDFRELCITVPTLEAPAEGNSAKAASDLTQLSTGHESQSNARKGESRNDSKLEDRGYVPGMVRVFDCHGFVTGYVPAINIARARRQRLLKLGESEDARAERHERARASTSALAQKLTTHEILSRWEAMPQIPRRLVGGNGMTQTVPPLTLAHVSMLKESGRTVAPGVIKPRAYGASSVSLPAIHG